MQSYIAFKLLAILRDKVFTALRRLAPAKLEGRDKGNLIYLITSDIEALEVFYAHTISPVLIAVFTCSILLIEFAKMHLLFFFIALSAYLFCGVVLPVIITKLGKQEGTQSREGFWKPEQLCSGIFTRYAGCAAIPYGNQTAADHAGKK